MRLIESQRVHCPDLRILARVFLPVALEAEVALAFLLDWLAEVDIDDTAAALNRADRIPLAAPEAADGARRELELALDDRDRVVLLESNLAQIEDVNLLVRVDGHH